MIPKAPGRLLIYKMCPLFYLFFFIVKHAYILRVGGVDEFSAGRIFHKEDSRWWIFQGKFYTEWISQNSYTKFLYISCFLFTDSILRVEILKVVSRGKFSPELSIGYFCGEGILPWRWSQVSWCYWKMVRN